MRAHRYALPGAILATTLATGAALVLLIPRHGSIQPVSVPQTAYFTSVQIERAQHFRTPQQLILVANLALTATTLVVLSLRPPRRVRRCLNACSKRPLVGAFVTGGALFVVVALVTLPLQALSHKQAVDVGLSTQGWGFWLSDVAKSEGLTAVGIALAGLLAMALMRRFRHWWIPASIVVVFASTCLVILSPIVLDPLFNRFTPLPQGPLRSEVMRLANQAGVEVGQVYRVDASSRTTGANAYVTGLSRTKRVVLYDNLIDSFPPNQVASVVAHELGHVKHSDVARAILWTAIVTPFSLVCVQLLTERFAPGLTDVGGAHRPAQAKPTPKVLPALALSVFCVWLPIGCASNVLSRAVEARADAFALTQTRDPAAFIELQRRLTDQNVSEPKPPFIYHVLFDTHPSALERIGVGVSWQRSAVPRP
jgi:STE24 endopeptidase